MAVNVSVDQIGPELIDTVVHALASAGARPGDLCLEVTESILIGDSDAPVATLDGLAALGVRLSMDDFGTGYSSLSHLQRFPLDELKIDKSFIDGVDDGGNDTAIVAATVAMAHALGLAVVAEGVERPEQFERLRVLGCQEVQGYLISRPQPAEAVTQLLADDGWGQWRTAARAGETIPASAADRPARILVVDDARDVRQLARMAMTAAGFDVDDVACGRGALRAARETRPDCVVLDVAMPDMSGFEVCRALRAAPATAGCTIVMLSSHTGAHDKIDAFSCGADDYIVKPFAPRDLVGRVRAAMKVRNDGGCGSGLTRGNPS